MNTYQILQLKDSSHSNTMPLLEAAKVMTPALNEAGLEVYGTFVGLFGLATNECYLVTYGEASTAELLNDRFEIIMAREFVPTVRPADFSPRTEPGIYVFRWFQVNMKDVDEIADLSNTAWNTFEGDFDTEVQGLFVQAEKGPEQGEMLLLTWYRNLTVWEESRQPSAEARENFLRRQKLVLEARPIATRLFL